MIPEFNEIDFLTEMRQKVTEQFKGKPIFDKYLQLEAENKIQLQDVFKQLLQSRSIDEAVGAQLDIIGRIVGQPRELISLDLYKYFSFKSYPNGDTYGDYFDPSVGGYWYSEGAPVGGNYLLDDSTYRLFIRSKILKNRTASTPEELISFLQYLFGNSVPIYLKEGSAHVNIFFGRELSTLEKNLLRFTSYNLGYPSKLIPITTGVGTDFGFFKADSFFAFQGIPNAKGFGDADAESGFGDSWDFDFGGTDSTNLIGGYFASYLNV